MDDTPAPRDARVVQVPPLAGRRRSSNGKVLGRRSGSSENVDSPLACLSCRQKKVKCLPGPNGCTRCLKLRLKCVEPEVDERKRPSSKSHIKELYDRISYLEEELRRVRIDQNAAAVELTPGELSSRLSAGSRTQSSLPSPEDGEGDDARSGITHRMPEPTVGSKSENLIARLCGSRWQLNSDEGGQLHFYGPTSSLHLTENISSSILQEGDHAMGKDHRIYDVAPELQAYLLELYWKYQNSILQVVHKEAFLNDMATGQTRYYSTLLLYCIFACAARISDRPDIRSLAFPPDDDLDEEQPYFVKRATQLLEVELKRPQITTIQSLQLLSVLDCARSNDTKGWLFTGDACRLAFDIGLHRDCSHLQSSNGFTQMDLEARSVVFWGCFVFDRLWAMYLGRPHCIKLNDVTVPRPGERTSHHQSWDLKIAAAWADLLEMLGHICDALNGNNLTKEKTALLNSRLYDWHAKLDTGLRPTDPTAPAVYVLHMQYNSALILLNRPAAGFGANKSSSNVECLSEATMKARSICIQNTIAMADLLQGYEKAHGDASSMSGVALHPISTAATVLISEIVDRKGHPPSATEAVLTSRHLWCLKRCIKSLSEMERSYPVARRVRKIIQLIMKLCNLGDLKLPKPDHADELEMNTMQNSKLATPHNVTNLQPTLVGPLQQYDHDNRSRFLREDHGGSVSEHETSFPDSFTWDMNWSPQDLNPMDENAPMTSQMDILYSFESFFGNHGHFA